MARSTNQRTNLAMQVLIVLCAVFAALWAFSSAQGVQTGNIRIITGMATNEVTIQSHEQTCGGVYNTYWHCDEPGVNAANLWLDLTNAIASTAGSNVYLQTFGYSGYAYGYVEDHIGSCPGADVRIWIPYPDASVGTWISRVNYVQFPRSIAVGTSIYIGSNWTVVYLGQIGSGSACPLSMGPHLHQSATPGSFVATNTPVTADDDSGIAGIQIYPTNSYYDNWLHNIAY